MIKNKQKSKIFKRQGILYESLNEDQVGLSNSKLQQRLNHWDQTWTLALLGRDEALADHDSLFEQEASLETNTSETKSHIEWGREFWLEAFLNLSPNTQALLIHVLGPQSLLLKSHTQIVLNSVDQSRLNTLISAGWLIEDHDQRREYSVSCTLLQLQEIIHELAYAPQLFSRLSPLAAQRVIQLASNSLHDSHSSECKGLIKLYQLRYQLWLSELKNHVEQSTENQQQIDLLKDQEKRVLEQLKHCGLLSNPLNSEALYSNLKIGEPSLEEIEIAEEKTSLIGDLEGFTLSLFQQAVRLIELGELAKAITCLANAHSLFWELKLDRSAFECRQLFMLLLAQSGHAELAKLLLKTEEQTRDLLNIEDELGLTSGLIAAHQADWSLAFMYFSQITQVSSDLWIWKALSVFKSRTQMSDTEPEPILSPELVQKVNFYLKQVSLTETSSYDLAALIIWLKTVMLDFEAQTLSSDDVEQWIAQTQSLALDFVHLSQETQISRGQVYLNWAQDRLKSLLQQLGQHEISEQVQAQTHLASLSEQTQTQWLNGHKLIREHLQSEPSLLTCLISPHCHSSQRRTVLRFAHKNIKETCMLWELDHHVRISKI